MQQWIDANGRVPMWSDWEHSGHGHPTAKTIDRRWGWEAFRAVAINVPTRRLREVKVRARAGFSGHDWTLSGLLTPLVEHYEREGAWPTGHEWEAATPEHPTWRTYRRHFGSWQQAIDAAARELARRRATGARAVARRRTAAAASSWTPNTTRRPGVRQ